MKKILVIDDNLQILKVLKAHIEKLGYHCVVTDQSTEVISLVEENEIDLVITDIVMPKQDGVETIIQIKKKFPNLKIIAISGDSKLNVNYCTEIAELLGADASFRKPFDYEKLSLTLHELLSE